MNFFVLQLIHEYMHKYFIIFVGCLLFFHAFDMIGEEAGFKPKSSARQSEYSNIRALALQQYSMSLTCNFIKSRTASTACLCCDLSLKTKQ